MAKTYLALNAGTSDAKLQLVEAVMRIAGHPEIKAVARSTAMVVPAAKRRRCDVHHQVMAIETTLKPRALLDFCLSIEVEMGRKGLEVWARHTIDIDLIAYEDFVIKSSRLTLPHPYAHSRSYVLEPLREIAPGVADWVVARSKAPR